MTTTAGHLYLRSSLSRVGDRPAQRNRTWAVAEGGTKCLAIWGQTVNSVGGGGEGRRVDVRWKREKKEELSSKGNFCTMVWSWSFLVCEDSCPQEWRHLYPLPFMKPSAAIIMLPYSLHWLASDVGAIFYSTEKHFLFEVKSNLVL